MTDGWIYSKRFAQCVLITKTMEIIKQDNFQSLTIQNQRQISAGLATY